MPFPTTIEQVRKTEGKLGRKLPPTYVGRMKKTVAWLRRTVMIGGFILYSTIQIEHA
jgi:hypothetical protein